jgi:hypothetical protein
MLNDPKYLSLLAAARKAMPWWMVHIHQYDGLTIHPCRTEGRAPNGKQVAAPCHPLRAEFWAVYGHNSAFSSAAGFDAFEDFETEGEAHVFRDGLLTAFPHLEGSRAPCPLNHTSNPQT